MLVYERVDIYPLLPATNYPPTRKHVVLRAAETKIHLTAHPGTSNPIVIVRFDH